MENQPSNKLIQNKHSTMHKWHLLLKLKKGVRRKSGLFMMYSIEHDANLLANRIALLKQEEMKTWKKIDDTRKRTTEIISLKNRNEDRIKQKEREFNEKQEMERYQSTQNYMIQKQRAEEKRKVQKAIYLSKTEEAKQAKIVKVQNEQLIRHQEFKVETENKMKNQIVN